MNGSHTSLSSFLLHQQLVITHISFSTTGIQTDDLMPPISLGSIFNIPGKRMGKGENARVGDIFLSFSLCNRILTAASLTQATA